MIDILKQLASDSNNLVFIISGSNKQFMDGVFGKFPEIGLVADGGNNISWPTEGEEREWKDMIYQEFKDNEWKSVTLDIMKRYTLLTNGSSIDNNPHQLRWDIQFTDPEWGKYQADSMVEKLEVALEDYGVEISREIGAVCVTPSGFNRGLITKHIMKKYLEKNDNKDPGFIFAVGDDACDEPIFSYLGKFLRERNYDDFELFDEDQAGNKHCITCHVYFYYILI